MKLHTDPKLIPYGEDVLVWLNPYSNPYVGCRPTGSDNVFLYTIRHHTDDLTRFFQSLASGEIVNLAEVLVWANISSVPQVAAAWKKELNK